MAFSGVQDVLIDYPRKDARLAQAFEVHGRGCPARDLWVDGVAAHPAVVEILVFLARFGGVAHVGGVGNLPGRIAARPLNQTVEYEQQPAAKLPDSMVLRN
jgi:hypothetical protein